MTLTELIERLEKAGAGSADLDREIAQRILGWTEYERGYGTGWRTSDGTPKTWHEIPRTTRSLDAALTLVPEGFVYLIREGHPDLPDGSGRTLHFANARPVADFRNDHRAYGNTPILALCIAALKARAGKDTA